MLIKILMYDVLVYHENELLLCHFAQEMYCMEIYMKERPYAYLFDYIYWQVAELQAAVVVVVYWWQKSCCGCEVFDFIS